MTVKLFGLKWEARRLVAVVIATVGAAVIAYGGSSSPVENENSEAKAADSNAPLVGDLLTLVASIIYGVYQVLYKMYAALPAQPDATFEVAIDPAYEPILSQGDDTEAAVPDKPEMVYPPPFGLYANALTSAIGICTLLILWIPIPILHYLDLETFRLPPDMRTVFVLCGISLSGVVFNAGLMVCFRLPSTWKAMCAEPRYFYFLDPAWSLGPHRHFRRQLAHHCPRVYLRHRLRRGCAEHYNMEHAGVGIYHCRFRGTCV